MTFRAIDLAGLSAVTVQAQALPILQWVDIDQIVIDTRYQRELGPRNLKAIQTIADSFDWMQFSPVLLAASEGGKFAIIDGQHRAHAAALCGFQAVPAQIVTASPKQQARAFAGVNATVTPITQHHVYRAALAAEEAWALRCREVVEAAGCRLATSNPSGKDRKPRVIYQLGTVRNMIVVRGQAEALGFVLRGLTAFDTVGRVALYTDYVVRPMVEAVHSDPSLLAVDLAAFCAKRDPFKVLEQTLRLRLAGHAASYMGVMRAALQKFLRGAA